MGFLEFFVSVPLFYSRVSVPFIQCLILFFIIMVSRSVSALENSNFVLPKSKRDTALRICYSDKLQCENLRKRLCYLVNMGWLTSG